MQNKDPEFGNRRAGLQTGSATNQYYDFKLPFHFLGLSISLYKTRWLTLSHTI